MNAIEAGGFRLSDIRARVAYLQGLAEGLDLDAGTAEGRILTSMIDVLGEMADEVISITEAQEDLVEYMDEVDHDLGDVEETLFGDEESSLAEDEDELDGVPHLHVCPQCGEETAGFESVEVVAETVCPSCGCEIHLTSESH